MKCLVTGATGFMGSAVVRSLLEDGQEVRALVRPGADQRNLDGLDIEIAPGDITDVESVRRAVRGCDSVYHLAAMVSFWVPLSQRHLFDRVNVIGTKNVLGAAYAQGVSKVIYTSTISTIGSYGKDTPTTEEHIFNLWDMSMEYERSKFSAEFEAWRFAARGLPVIAVLPAAPVGARDIKPNPVGRLILDFLGRRIPGYIDGGGNFIDVDDVGRGHVLAGRLGKPGERYIIGGENLTTAQLFGALEAVSGVPAPRFKLPVAGTLGLAHLLEFSSNRLTRRPPLLTPPLVKFASKYYFVDTSKAQRELGFVPRGTVQQAAAKAIRWFLDNGYIKANERKLSRIHHQLESTPALALAA